MKTKTIICKNQKEYLNALHNIPNKPVSIIKPNGDSLNLCGGMATKVINGEVFYFNNKLEDWNKI